MALACFCVTEVFIWLNFEAAVQHVLSFLFQGTGGGGEKRELTVEFNSPPCQHSHCYASLECHKHVIKHVCYYSEARSVGRKVCNRPPALYLKERLLEVNTPLSSAGARQWGDGMEAGRGFTGAA